jgi:hypothetical protein
MVSEVSRSMKSRHAAALALVGWYLMLPPIVNPAYPGRVAPTAPISHWYFYNERKGAEGARLTQQNALVFGSEEACKAKLMHQREIMHKLATVVHHDMAASLALWDNAICIGTDDPRLNRN